MADAYKPINGGGLQQYPYNAHKRWVVTDSNYRQAQYDMSILKGISPLYNEKVPLSSSVGGENVAALEIEAYFDSHLRNRRLFGLV